MGPIETRHHLRYQASVVVREKALAENPGLEAALNELSGAIGDSAIRRLNYQVDGKHWAVAEVAAEFLAARGELSLR